MKGKLFALAASLALHLLFALALITLANWAARFTPPSIEVSAIEFSFAELDSPAPPAAPPPEPPQTSKPPEREALNIQDAPASNFQAAEPPNIQDAPASNLQAAEPPNIQDAPASNLQAAEPPNIQDAPASNLQAAQPPNIQDAPASNFQAAQPPNIQDAPASNLQAAQPPNQARIDAPPRPLKAIRPEYPKASRQRGEEGDVVVVLSINEQGHVDSASVAESSGYQELDAAAIRAANKARFSPAKRGRTAVASEARVTITFRLTGK